MIIEVSDVNDLRPTFEPASKVLYISEAAVEGTSYTLPTAFDLDSPQYSVQKYFLVEENISENDGVLNDESGSENNYKKRNGPKVETDGNKDDGVAHSFEFKDSLLKRSKRYAETMKSKRYEHLKAQEGNGDQVSLTWLSRKNNMKSFVNGKGRQIENIYGANNEKENDLKDGNNNVIKNKDENNHEESTGCDKYAIFKDINIYCNFRKCKYKNLKNSDDDENKVEKKIHSHASLPPLKYHMNTSSTLTILETTSQIKIKILLPPILKEQIKRDTELLKNPKYERSRQIFQKEIKIEGKQKFKKMKYNLGLKKQRPEKQKNEIKHALFTTSSQILIPFKSETYFEKLEKIRNLEQYPKSPHCREHQTKLIKQTRKLQERNRQKNQQYKIESKKRLKRETQQKKNQHKQKDKKKQKKNKKLQQKKITKKIKKLQKLQKWQKQSKYFRLVEEGKVDSPKELKVVLIKKLDREKQAEHRLRVRFVYVALKFVRFFGF